MRTRFIASLTVVVTLVVLSGCDSKENTEVSGTVNIDGSALKEGDILFESSDGSAAPAAGKIVNGKYSLKVPPGAKKVLITATREGKKKDAAMGAAAREQMIAPEFNVKTTLTADIKAGKQDGVNFEVKSIP
jgi:hypothetical protein